MQFSPFQVAICNVLVAVVASSVDIPKATKNKIVEEEGVTDMLFLAALPSFTTLSQ